MSTEDRIKEISMQLDMFLVTHPKYRSHVRMRRGEREFTHACATAFTRWRLEQGLIGQEDAHVLLGATGGHE